MSDLFFQAGGRIKSSSTLGRDKSFATVHRLGVGHIDYEPPPLPPGSGTGRVRVTVGGAVRVTVDGSVRETPDLEE